MSEECLKNAQDLTKSQKHDPLTHSPIWIQEMLAHLKTALFLHDGFPYLETKVGFHYFGDGDKVFWLTRR